MKQYKLTVEIDDNGMINAHEEFTNLELHEIIGLLELKKQQNIARYTINMTAEKERTVNQKNEIV